MKKILFGLSLVLLIVSIYGIVHFYNYQNEIKTTVVNPLNRSAYLVNQDLKISYESFKEVKETILWLGKNKNNYFSKIALNELKEIENLYVHLLYQESDEKSDILLKQILGENLEKLANRIDQGAHFKNRWFEALFVFSAMFLVICVMFGIFCILVFLFEK